MEVKAKVHFLLDRCGIQNILYTCSFVLESLYICSYVATMFLYRMAGKFDRNKI